MIETIIFDIGDTLLRVSRTEDFYTGIADEVGLEHDAIMRIRGDIRSVRKQFNKGVLSEIDFYKEVYQLLRVKSIDTSKLKIEKFYDAWNRKAFLGINEPVSSISKELKTKGLDIQILSNINSVWTGYILRTYPQALAHFGNNMTLSYVVGELKGEGRTTIYHHAFKRSRAQRKENCIFIDDAKENIEESARYGFKGFHYNFSALGYDDAAEQFRDFLKKNDVRVS